MKRPMGYRTIKCPHCGEKIRLQFRTLHRLKIEVEINPVHTLRGKVEEGGKGVRVFHSTEAKDDESA